MPRTSKQPLPPPQDIIDSALLAIIREVDRIVEKSEEHDLSDADSRKLCQYVATLTKVKQDMRIEKKEADFSQLSDEDLNNAVSDLLKLNPAALDSLNKLGGKE